jgi:methionyl-tRNA formyltransferase
MCLSAGFNYLFPASFIQSASVCLNVHASLLPKYRGLMVGWLIPDGEMETGITVHVVDEGADTGDILLQRAFPLTAFDTYRSMMRKAHATEGQVVVDALSIWESLGRSALRTQHATPEDARGARRPADSQFDPSRSMTDLFDHIRSCDPEAFPAFFYHHGEKVCVRLWRPDKDESENDLV